MNYRNVGSVVRVAGAALSIVAFVVLGRHVKRHWPDVFWVLTLCGWFVIGMLLVSFGSSIAKRR